MAILKILKFPDHQLRHKAQHVNEVSPQLVKLSEDMLETMYHHHGVGLASIQVANLAHVLVADTRSEFDTSKAEHNRYQDVDLKQDLAIKIKQPLILFNPKIIDTVSMVTFSEGCLSFPSYFASVKRAQIVTIKALNQQGEPVTITTDGLLSICLQHEIDHLDGRLFIDHLSPLRAKKLREEIKKYGYPKNTKDTLKD